MTPPEFMFLSPIKGLSFAHLGYSSAASWEEELDPGFVWRTARKTDPDLFDHFWGFFADGIAVWERDQLKTADTWLEGEVAAANTIQQVPGQVVSFAVTATLHGRVTIFTRFMIFKNRDEGPSPWASPSVDPIRTLRLGPWPFSVSIDDESRRRVKESYQHVRRAFDAPPDHAFLRAIGRYRGAVFSQWVESTAILLCASLEALGKFKGEPGQARVTDRLIPRYSKKQGNEIDVLKQLYDLRHASAHGGVHEDLDTREKRIEALDRGLALTRHIVRNALADNDLYARATKGPPAMMDYLDTPP